jgi:hypothetical protein
MGNLDDFFAGLEENLPSERFLPLWGGAANANFNMASPPYQYTGVRGRWILRSSTVWNAFSSLHT